MYTYFAKLDRIIDGDTLEFTADLGFGVWYKLRGRLSDIDTPEKFGVKKDSKEYEAGVAASKFVTEWFDSLGSDTVIIETKKDKKEKFGRWLITVWSIDKTKNLNEDLVAAGHAEKMLYG